MFPLFPFATGLLVGVLGVRLAKSATRDGGSAPGEVGSRTRSGFDRACDGLRDAAVSSLAAVEKSSAGLREKLTPRPEAGETPPGDAEPPAGAPCRPGEAAETAS